MEIAVTLLLRTLVDIELRLLAVCCAVFLLACSCSHSKSPSDDSEQIAVKRGDQPNLVASIKTSASTDHKYEKITNNYENTTEALDKSQNLEEKKIEPKALLKTDFSKLPKTAQKQIRRYLRAHRRIETVSDNTFEVKLPVKEVYRFDKGFIVTAYAGGPLAGGATFAHSEILYFNGTLSTIIDSKNIETPSDIRLVDHLLQVDYDHGCCGKHYRYRTWYGKNEGRFKALFSTLLPVDSDYRYDRIGFRISSEFNYSRVKKSGEMHTAVSYRISNITNNLEPLTMFRETVVKTTMVFQDDRLVSKKGADALSQSLLDAWVNGKYRGWRINRRGGPIGPFLLFISDKVGEEAVQKFINTAEANTLDRFVQIGQKRYNDYWVKYPHKAPRNASLFLNVDLNGDHVSDKILVFSKANEDADNRMGAYLSLSKDRYLEVFSPQIASYLMVDNNKSFGMRTIWTTNHRDNTLKKWEFDGLMYRTEPRFVQKESPVSREHPAKIPSFNYSNELGAARFAALSGDGDNFVVLASDYVDEGRRERIVLERYRRSDCDLLETILIDHLKELPSEESSKWRSLLGAQAVKKNIDQVNNLMKKGAYSRLQPFSTSLFKNEPFVGIGGKILLVIDQDSSNQVSLVNLMNGKTFWQATYHGTHEPSSVIEESEILERVWYSPDTQELLIETRGYDGDRKGYRVLRAENR